MAIMAMANMRAWAYGLGGVLGTGFCGSFTAVRLAGLGLLIARFFGILSVFGMG